MTKLPRALIGPITAMARPARPATEITAVHEAAALIRREGGLASPPNVARMIAGRVVEAMLTDIACDDPLALAMAAIEQQLLPSPFVTLATCPEINTLEAYVERRAGRLRSRSARDLSPIQQDAERESVAAEVQEVLTGRYLRHLRDSA